MIKRRFAWIIALVAVVLLLPVTPVLADDEPPGITIFGEDYTIESGTTIKGNLTVFDGDVTVENGGTVAGTVVIWGGNAESPAIAPAIKAARVARKGFTPRTMRTAATAPPRGNVPSTLRSGKASTRKVR